MTTVGEEKTRNPRVGGERRWRFVGYMQTWTPHPSNLIACLRTCNAKPRPNGAERRMGPAVRTFAGGLEIDPYGRRAP